MGNITQLFRFTKRFSFDHADFEILDEPEEELNEQDPLPEPILGSVEFENVSFSYDPENR